MGSYLSMQCRNGKRCDNTELNILTTTLSAFHIERSHPMVTTVLEAPYDSDLAQQRRFLIFDQE
jgi:hypothetical protein